MIRHAASTAFAWLLIAAGACSASPGKPLVPGPPPEYEAPRDYTTTPNIDGTAPSATAAPSAVPSAIPSATPSAAPGAAPTP
jgi:hypothetical protein